MKTVSGLLCSLAAMTLLSNCYFHINSFEHVSGGGISSSSGTKSTGNGQTLSYETSISGPYSYFNNQIPAVMFSIHKKDSEDWQYSYLMIIKYQEIRIGQFDLVSSGDIGDEVATDSTHLRIWDFDVNVIFEMKDQSKTLMMNNEFYQTDRLNLFLVDMTNRSLDIEVVKLNDDSSVYRFMDVILLNEKNVTLDWMKILAADMIETLRKDIPEVEAFLK